MKNIKFNLCFILLLCCSSVGMAQQGKSDIHWQPWSAEVFTQAAAENKFVLLDMEAVWCHWCHVMDQKTYRDKAVIAYLKKHYITVKVDQDNRPDLAQRYRDYGWPATIIFDSKGTEIVKRAGYIAANNMHNLLQAVVADPSPERHSKAVFETAPQNNTGLSKKLQTTLLERFYSSHDYQIGGLTSAQKFMDRDQVEYALWRAARGDSKAAAMAERTLQGALNLLDPVWGGVYQYSTGYDWQHPHYEKIMAVQTGYLRLYILAWLQFKRPEYLAAAVSIGHYLQNFLHNPKTGAFYVSQDADVVQGQHSNDYFALSDSQRRKQGMPRIDTHEYSRETAWASEAFALLYQATQNSEYLKLAENGLLWAIAERALAGGGYRHDAVDAAGPYLADSLAMTKALLEMHRTTGLQKWLTKAQQSADFIAANFAATAGYYTAKPDGSPIAPVLNIDENMTAARLFNLLHHYSGEDKYATMATTAFYYLAAPNVALARFTEAGILLAHAERAAVPPHYTIIGSYADATAKQLFGMANAMPQWFRRVEWWDKSQEPLQNQDVGYPNMDKTAAFVCGEGRCSLPSFNPQKYAKQLEVYQTRLLSRE